MTQPVEVNSAQVKEVISLFEFIGGNSKDAFRIAINKTLPIAKTAASVGIRAELKIKASEVKKKLVNEKATRGKLQGRIKSSKKGRLLARYSTTAAIRNNTWAGSSPPPVPKRGIRVEVTPGQRKVVRGSSDGKGSPFYILLKNGVVSIAQRRKTAGPRGGKLLLLYGPSVSQAFGNIKEDVAAEDIYQSKMLESINYLLRKEHPV
jgi:hypothetical protein